MKVLVVIFGGMDHQFLAKWNCKHLRQAQWGKVVVDGLFNKRDVATQITAQLITGETWEKNGVFGRKREFYDYRNRFVKWLEGGPLKNVDFTRTRRQGLYQFFGITPYVRSREFLKDDLTCPSLFDVVEGSKPVYVPAYNPEPSWALGRNILNPCHYPELGVEGALDLLEKNFAWRKKKFMAALRGEAVPLLVGQFQYIDSAQHLYLSEAKFDPPKMDEVEQVYWRMDAFAAEILELAEGKYDRVLFISDNGAARETPYRPTHHNRPCYSINVEEEIDGNNLRDFYKHILNWVTSAPNPGKIHENGS